MRYFIFVIVTLFFLTSFSQAQDNKGYFKKGSKALLFEFSGLADLGAGSFNGGLGGKYFIDHKLAIRGSLQFMDLNEDIPYEDDSGVDGKRTANRFGISAAVEVHFDTSRVNPYFGGGVGFAVTSTEYKSDASDLTNQVTVKNDEDGEFGYYGGTEFTIFGILGVEVFIIKNLSLAAEYRLGYAYISKKDEEIIQGNTTITNRQGSITGFGLESSGALILSVYF